MNRRRFLAGMAAALAGAAYDPEKLLWVQGKKKIFIPPATVTVEPVVVHYSGGWTSAAGISIYAELENINAILRAAQTGTPPSRGSLRVYSKWS